MSAFRYLLMLCSISFLLLSCSHKVDNNELVIDQLNESLGNSSWSVNRSTEIISNTLAEKLKEPSTRYRATIWHANAMLARKYSEEMRDYINEIRQSLGKENTAVANVVTPKKIKQFAEKLIEYHKNLLLINPFIDSAFDALPVILNDTLLKNRNGYALFLFTKDISTSAALALLNQFTSNVLVMENRVVQFCNNKVGDGGDYFTVYSALIVPSSKYVKPGEKIEITAGIGVFSTRAMPVITVNGKSVLISEDAAGHYIFKASTRPGKHYVPVKIDFTTEYETKETIEKNVEYVVADY